MCQGRIIKFKALIVAEMSGYLLPVGNFFKNDNQVFSNKKEEKVSGEHFNLQYDKKKKRLYIAALTIRSS